MKNNMLKNMLGVGREIMSGMKKKPAMYTRDWVNSVSRAEFDREREHLRQAYLNGDTVAWTIMKNLDKFLSEMQWRKWYEQHPGEEPKFYQKPHGRHLEDDEEDDD